MGQVKILLVVFAVAWYVSIGLLVSSAVEARVRVACPGHRTAWEAYWFVKPFTVASWPMVGTNDVFLLILPNVDRVCDRFDPPVSPADPQERR